VRSVAAQGSEARPPVLSLTSFLSYLQDTFIKFWDLDTQACIHTLVGHRSEVRRNAGQSMLLQFATPLSTERPNRASPLDQPLQTARLQPWRCFRAGCG
jgi:hypothetical protein